MFSTSCDGGSYKVRERVFGSCQRSICLPDNIDEAGAKCCNTDGVLVIDFPKKIGKDYIIIFESKISCKYS